jgi:uncharacterized membrane protein
LSLSNFGSGVFGAVATLGAVAVGAAILEAALVPGILIGGAAVLAPRLLPRDGLSGLGSRLRRAVTSPLPVAAAPKANSTAAPESGRIASFDARRAVVKTLTYRVAITSIDFGANYFVIGGLGAAAGLATLSIVAGPLFYFAHEAAWQVYGPALALDKGRTRFLQITVSRAFAKTVTYEVVTVTSEFGVNYLFSGDLAAAAGLTAFTVIVSPLVYYIHERG